MSPTRFIGMTQLTTISSDPMSRAPRAWRGIGQRPHRNRPVLGSHAAEFTATDPTVRAPQVRSTKCRQHSRRSNANHDDVGHSTATLVNPRITAL
jgi:hypothetical protein